MGQTKVLQVLGKVMKELDDTLSVKGKAADAKAVGDALLSLTNSVVQPPSEDGKYVLEPGKTYRIVKESKTVSGITSFHFTGYVFYGPPGASYEMNQTVDKVFDIDSEMNTHLDNLTVRFLDLTEIESTETVSGVQLTHKCPSAWVEIDGELKTIKLYSGWSKDYQLNSYDIQLTITTDNEVSIVNEVAHVYGHSGTDGESVFIRYSQFSDGSSYTENWKSGYNYIGIATGLSAPAHKSGYQWIKFAQSDAVSTADIEKLDNLITQTCSPFQRVTGAFTERTTANGLDIIDKSECKIEAIYGDTVFVDNKPVHAQFKEIVSRDAYGNIKSRASLDTPIELAKFDYLSGYSIRRGTLGFTLDGTDDFWSYVTLGEAGNTFNAFRYDLYSAYVEGATYSTDIIANRYATSTGKCYEMNDGEICMGDDYENEDLLYIFIRDDRYTSLADFKTHLSENPLVVEVGTGGPGYYIKFPASYIVCNGGTETIVAEQPHESLKITTVVDYRVVGSSGGGGSSVEIAQSTGESETAVMSQAAATHSFVNINEDGSASVGPPTSGESAINAYALKRHLSRHSTLYPSKEEAGVTVVNKLKYVMPTNDSYFAMVGDHSAETGGINPKVSFDTSHAVHIPSVVPTAQYEEDGYTPVPVDLPVNSIRIGAFQQNRTVRSVVIQEGVARIEANAFNGCKQLTSIVLADTIKMIDNNAFNNVGTEVSSAKIPVKLPKALEYICQQAFNQVNVCGPIVFPNRCLYIGCIPSNLTSGVGKVFTSQNITQIVFEGTPKYIHSDSFKGCTCDIYVPWDKNEVAGAPWGTTGTVHYNSYPNAFPDSIEIVQKMGESTTAVMSQKAVYDMWDGMENEIYAVAEDVSTLWSDQGWQNERHDELVARVEALEEGGGGSSVEIVQETGTSTEAVMSQNAVTKQLNNKVTVGSADMAYPVLYGLTPNGYYGGGAQKMYKISDRDYAPSTSSGSGALVKWHGYGTSGQIINENAPQSSSDLSNKKYVDARSGYITTVYWSSVQGSEKIVYDRGTAYNYPSNMIPNSEYCIGFCNTDGSYNDSIDPTSGQLRFNGVFDEVLLRGEGNKECIAISGKEDGYFPNGAIIKFTDAYLRGTYKILKFRELPCPCGPVVLLIEVIY